MIVSHQDPGVANWLDPGGRTCGTVAVRYLLLDDPDAVLPPARLRRSPFDRLPSPRPPSAGPAVSPDERVDRIRERHRAAMRRLQW